MPLIAKPSEFEPAPAGTHIARCFGVVDLGTQPSDIYAPAQKVLLLFELPYELIEWEEGGQKHEAPMTISKEYRMTIGKKANLRRDLISWRGRDFTEEELAGFNVGKVCGVPCQVNIVHGVSGKGSRYAKVESISGLAKGMGCPDPYHPTVLFELEMGKECEVFKKLPEWIQKKILGCMEWNPDKSAPANVQPTAPTDGPSEPPDDVPF